MSKLINIRSFVVASVLLVAFVGATFTNESTTSLSVPAVFAQDEPLDLSALDDVLPAYANDEPPAMESDANPAPNEANQAPSAGEARGKTLQLVAASGWIGVVLLLGSIVAVTLIIRLLLTIRRPVFIPRDVKSKLADLVERGDVAGALNVAQNSDSFLARVASFGLAESDRGWTAVEKALEDAVAEETAKIYRRTDLLATIGNVAPMLGLLGTVLGMVATFGELAVSDDSGRNLANGIYFALVTTVDGLIVAIPVLVARSLINAKIASLVSETVETLNEIFTPLKRIASPDRQVRLPEKPASAPQERRQSAPSPSRPAPASGGLREIPRPGDSPSQPASPQRESGRPTLALRGDKRGSDRSPESR